MYFQKPMQVQLQAATLERAYTFAKNVINTVNYSDSNQYNHQKIQTDHLISKLGEEAVYSVLRHFAVPITPPDYRIYEAPAKSWEADLKVDGLPWAVKTQTYSQAQKYGLSWTFQASPKRFDPILKQPNYWVCFVLCYHQHLYSDNRLKMSTATCTCIVYPPKQIKDLVFSEPKLPYLKGKKKVVYASQFTS